MNKTMSKAKELLLNSRLIRQKENQEENNENSTVHRITTQKEEVNSGSSDFSNENGSIFFILYL
jgi:hypothetical protein